MSDALLGPQARGPRSRYSGEEQDDEDPDRRPSGGDLLLF